MYRQVLRVNLVRTWLPLKVTKSEFDKESEREREGNTMRWQQRTGNFEDFFINGMALPKLRDRCR